MKKETETKSKTNMKKTKPEKKLPPMGQKMKQQLVEQKEKSSPSTSCFKPKKSCASASSKSPAMTKVIIYCGKTRPL